MAKTNHNPALQFSDLKVGDQVRITGYWPGKISREDSGRVGRIRRFNKAGRPVVDLSNDARVTIPDRAMLKASQEPRSGQGAERTPQDTPPGLDSLSRANQGQQTTAIEGQESYLDRLIGAIERYRATEPTSQGDAMIYLSSEDWERIYQTALNLKQLGEFLNSK